MKEILEEILEDIGEQIIKIEPRARYKVYDRFLFMYCYDERSAMENIHFTFTIKGQYLWSDAGNASAYCACNLANPDYVKDILAYMSKWEGSGFFRERCVNT